MTFASAFVEGLILIGFCHFSTLTVLARRDDGNLVFLCMSSQSLGRMRGAYENRGSKDGTSWAHEQFYRPEWH